jgi:uncharacterized protein YegJ (DUF2314 family)
MTVVTPPAGRYDASGSETAVPISWREALILILWALVAWAAGGCEAREPSSPPRTAQTPAAEATGPQHSDWQIVDSSPQIALPADEDDPALEAAIARARQTAEDARRRWQNTPPTDRWSAPTAEGSIEFLWVEPINWSQHRIEGRLANPPQHELACGKGLDELVTFPIEELVDWMHISADGASPAEGADKGGGFTVRLLEERHGRTDPGAPDGS